MPTLPQSIALHIGAHKTASSHLQKTLFLNRQLLSDEGIRYVGPFNLRRPGQSLQAMFNLSWSVSPAPGRGPMDQLALLSNGHRHLVISEENFVGALVNSKGRVSLPLYPSSIDRITELVAAWAPIKPSLFVAVRNPATFLSSAYGQALFGSAYVDPKAFRARNDWRVIDWADYIRRLRAIPGLVEVCVWRQEDYHQTHRFIIRTMVRWQGGGEMELIDERVHPGLSTAAVRQTLEWAQEGKTGNLAGDARGLFPVNDDNAAFQLYDRSTLNEAQQIYDAQMAQIEATEGVTILLPSDFKRAWKG